MGIFDGYQFGDTDQGGLIDRLLSTLGVQGQYQPGAGFGSNPMDANASMTAAQPPQNAPIGIGSYQMPRIGSGFDVPAAQPQANAVPLPVQQPANPQALPAALQPYHAPGGLSGAFQGAAANVQAGPIGMLLGGIGGAMGMGQGSDQTLANRATAETYRQLVPILGADKATLAILNPTLGQKMVETALAGKQYGFQMLPDGTMVRTDAHAGTVAPVYSGAAKPTFGVIDETDGKKTYGWIDPNKRSVTPYEGSSADDRGTVTGPDGKPIQIPPGVDRNTFVKEITKINADAAAGKKTEVQAKDEKFANKMELAEKNLKAIQGEGGSYLGRMAEGFPVVGNTAATNWMKSDNYQKYQQARDNFITALLRDESGAAIGTSEFVRYEKELFPQPGDGAAVIKQKEEARRIAIEGMKKGAGPGYKSPTLTGSSEPKADPLGIR